MQKFTFRIFFSVLSVLFSHILLAQTIVDYQAWNPSSPPCNIFGPAIDVPVTINGSSGTLNQQTAIGQPAYDGANKSVNLDSKINSSINEGTEYKMTVNFKKGYSYKITINAIRIMSSQTGPNVNLRLDLDNGSSGFNNTCNSTDPIDANTSGDLKKSLPVASTSFTATNANYVFDYISLASAQTFLMIAAVPPVGSVLQTILIRKITIVETAPPVLPVSFTLAPSSLNISCGSTTPQAFTVTNVNNTPGVTNHIWNLGVNNGWQYMGAPADQTISTGTTNAITLTPVCGNVQQNVSATVTANGTDYATNTTIVTKIIPGLSIGGNNTLCTGTEDYPIDNLPCGASVSWVSSDPNIATVSSSGNPATLTRVGNGVITLTATVNACGSQINLTPKAIAVGTLPAPEELYFNGFTIPGEPCLGGEEDFEVAVPNPVAGASYWWNVSGAGDFRFGQGDPDAGITTRPEPEAYMYVDVQPENGCGLGGVLSLAIQICDYGLGIMKNNFVVSPNPASEIITIQKNKNGIEQKTKQDPDRAIFTEVKIFDNMGILMKQTKYGKGTTLAQVNVAGLKKGIYYVEISNGKSKERHQLIIQK